MRICLIVMLMAAGGGVMAQDTLRLGAAQLEDAWIWSWPNVADINFGETNVVNQGLNNVVRMETWQWTTGRFDTIRNLLRFDASQLPANASIVSATLHLQHYANPNFQNHTGSNALEIALVTEPWVEGLVTWNNQPAYVAGGSLLFPASTSPTQNYSLDITPLADTIVAAGQPWSLLLKLQAESDFSVLTFASTEHSDSTLHPELELVYTVPALVGLDAEKTGPQVWLDRKAGLVHVELPLADSIAVYNLAGVAVFRSSDRKRSWQISAQAWQPGMYVVRSGNGQAVKVQR